jgi:hypothetical protein
MAVRFDNRLLKWVTSFRANLSPGVVFDLAEHMYLMDIYRCKAKHIVLCKAGQMGLSEYAMNRALYMCAEKKGNVFYVMPTDDDISDFSSIRFDPALEASPYLQKLVVGADNTSGKRGVDRITTKRIGDNYLVLRGGRVDEQGHARQLKSVPADLVIGDEVDEMDDRVPDIARKRYGHSRFKEEIWISTPTFPGVGIDLMYSESDQREWHVPCPHCGKWQPLTLDKVVVEWDDLRRPLAWHGMDEKRAWVACEYCHKELNRLAKGEWVATFPDREVAGFRPHKLFSAQNEIIYIIRGLQTANEDKRKEIYNQDMGEGYTPPGGKLEDETIMACARDYAHTKAWTNKAVLGADVGAMIHVVIRDKVDRAGHRRQLFAGEVASFDDVGHLANQYNVETGVIDIRPESRAAREFQATLAKNRIWVCDYVLDKNSVEPVVWIEEGPDAGLVKADRSRTLDETMARFFDQSNTLPGNIKSITDYFAHLKALTRVQTQDKRTGNNVVRYVGRKADHYLHAENYATIASMGAPKPRHGVPVVVVGSAKNNWLQPA